ncbi:GNAT family N-acetyltransferase [Shewanella acanthi]|uniref:GNAT family N-acetyltransferase n=1 Tax=Shewanella acanthi TaxID=2864212 RepID=UPI001C655782|nr:GNAT family N-acetyltransferase [Shewanella acanthi]QYJ77851.1 GNAT family N-acetyltransferase [Shewanella acanthi]
MNRFQYVLCQNDAELAAAAQLIENRDDNAHPLDHSVFARSRAVVLAKNLQGEIVGCAAIKAGEGIVGELGYLVVAPLYRRQGIAQDLTLKRIEVAKSLNIKLLFATIRDENTASRVNLLKAGFRFWRNYLSIRGTGNTIGWFYLALDPQLDIERMMLNLVGDRVQVK